MTQDMRLHMCVGFSYAAAPADARLVRDLPIQRLGYLGIIYYSIVIDSNILILLTG
jgi:hypothetical protein